MVDLSDKPDPKLIKLHAELLRRIYKNGPLPVDEITIDNPTAIYTAEKLMEGVYAGYGADFGSLQYDTPDYDKLSNLQRNVYQFSGAKNWHMLKELTLALVTVSPAELPADAPKILPFREFKNKAITILDEYDVRHLKTEYNAAIAGAQMASKWVAIEHAAALAIKNHTKRPQVQYRTMGDGRVREEHKVLDRITRPDDDNFWKTYYPPNGWNCRCTAVIVSDTKQTSDTLTNRAMASVEPQKGFGVNLAQKGFVFPKNSPYYIGLPADENKHTIAIPKNKSTSP